MAVATLPVLSREYVRVPVTAEGQDAVALRAMMVEFAFKLDKVSAPVDADWKPGTWDPSGDPATARILVGPTSSAALPSNTYFVWIRVTGSIERPVRPVGQLKIV